MQLLRILSILPLAAVASAQWYQTSPATVPQARLQHGMAFDSTNGRTILFGGGPLFGFSNLNDTWSYDGANWTQLTPGTSPSGRAGFEMVYDSLRQVVVMYGGSNPSPFGGGPSIDETWEYDGSSWNQVVTANTPGGRTWFGMAYDAGRNRTVLYGGLPDNFFPIDSAETWEYDGIDWTLVNTATSPGPLENQAMCYDPILGKVVMYGGIDVQVGGNTTTWTYDGVDWQTIPTVGNPGARALPRMVHDLSRGVNVLYGGMDPTNGNLFGDTWEFNGVTWTQVQNGTPAPRKWTRMVFDSSRNVAVMFGGHDAAFGGLTDTQEFGARTEPFGTGCLGSNGVPALSAPAAPRLGTPFTSTVSNLIPAAPFGIIATGFSDQLWGATPLPLDMTSFGLTGCTLYVEPEIVEVAIGGSLTLNIPADPIFYGVLMYQQGFSFEFPGWNPFGGTLSNATLNLIGN